MGLLPFLKKSKDGSGNASGVMVVEREPDGDKVSQNPALEACAEELLDAIKSNDIKKVASALQSAFEICDSYPHVEGPHIGEDGLE